MFRRPTKKRKVADAPYTELGEKYGHPVGPNHVAISQIRPWRSGITPLEPGPFKTEAARLEYIKLQNYQRDRFEGFTASDLHTIEALAALQTEDFKSYLDGVPIHPFFARERWDAALPRHLARYPLGKGREGYWEISNSIVWKALSPSLKLASLFLTNYHTWGWFDALLFGDYEDIDPSNVPEEDRSSTYKKFRVRPPTTCQQDQERRRAQGKLIDLSSNIDFFLVSGLNDPRNGLPSDPQGFLCGLTMHNDERKTGHTIVNIAFEVVQTLLRTDLTSAERMVEVFKLATTILHESTHAIWFELCNDYRTEPFFEGEVVTGLGFSMENAIFGGIPSDFVTTDSETCAFRESIICGGLFQTLWNNSAHSYDEVQLLAKPVDWFYDCSYPIPVHIFADFHNMDFWKSHIRHFGSTAAHLGPRTIGHRKLVKDRSRITSTYHTQLMDKGLFREIIPIDPKNTSDFAAKAAKMENDRRERTKRITNAAYLSQAEKAKGGEVTDDIKTVTFQEAPKSRPPNDLDTAPCPRYDFISDYLLQNAKELALDTLNFRMPDHTMMSHILHLGELVLDYDEWTSFLLDTHKRKLLFSYDTLSTGTITRIPSGWPKPDNTPKKQPKILSTDIVEAFVKCSDAVIGNGGCFENNYLDHDMEEFRYHCNREFQSQNLKETYENMLEGFDKDTFHWLVELCDYSELNFRFGPAGIIRQVRDIAVP